MMVKYHNRDSWVIEGGEVMRVSEVYTQANTKGNTRPDILDMSDGEEEGAALPTGRFASRLRETARGRPSRDDIDMDEDDDDNLTPIARGKRRAIDDHIGEGARSSARRRTATIQFGD